MTGQQILKVVGPQGPPGPPGRQETARTITDAGSAQQLPGPTIATVHDLTLTMDCILGFPDPIPGQTFTLILRQDVAGGHAVTWPDNIRWPGGIPPTVSATSGLADLFWFLADGTTGWFSRGMVQDL